MIPAPYLRSSSFLIKALARTILLMLKPFANNTGCLFGDFPKSPILRGFMIPLPKLSLENHSIPDARPLLNLSGLVDHSLPLADYFGDLQFSQGS